jgi:hypothetical protein
MREIHVVIEVADGAVIGIRSDAPDVDVRVLIADYDISEYGTYIIDGVEFNTINQPCVVDVDGTNAFFHVKRIEG